MFVLHSTIFVVLLGSALLNVSEMKFLKLPIISVKASCNNEKLTPGICYVDRSFYRPTECVKESFIKIIALKKAHFDIACWLHVHSSICHIRQYIPLHFRISATRYFCNKEKCFSIKEVFKPLMGWITSAISEEVCRQI